MIRRKLNVILLIAGMGFSSGCTSSGLKMPFRDTFASMSTHKKASKTASTAAGDQELSPEFLEAQKVFKKDPEGTLLAWARWQEDIGEYGEARKKYRELLIAYPANIEAQLGLARIELSCGRVQQAEDILRTVAKDLPDNAPVRLELGRLYTQQEDWPKAIAAFEDASAVDPEDQVCRYELGVAFARSHRYDQALAHLTYAVGESAANYNIGYVLHEQGNSAEAAEWFQNALQTHPDARTEEKTRAMLAQLTPRNSQDRSGVPTYPPANPSAMAAVAGRSRPLMTRQLEPASLEAPIIRSASARSTQSSAPTLPVVSNSPNLQQYSEPSTMLPPVAQPPSQYRMANQSARSTADTNTENPFQTVSHTVIQESVETPVKSGSQPPQWHGASHQTDASQAPQREVIAPAKWRGR